MAITVNGVLGVVIPAGVIIFFIALFYSKMPEPFRVVGNWIMNAVYWIKDGFSEKSEEYTTTIRYD